MISVEEREGPRWRARFPRSRFISGSSKSWRRPSARRPRTPEHQAEPRPDRDFLRDERRLRDGAGAAGQGRALRAAPVLVTVVLISIVGTLVSDNLSTAWGSAWSRPPSLSGSSSPSSSRSGTAPRGRSRSTRSSRGRRELFYWAAILFTFAMGTSVGDLFAERLDLGYGQAVVIFAARSRPSPCLLCPKDERDPLVLGGLHPDAAARGLGGRLAGEPAWPTGGWGSSRRASSSSPPSARWSST